MSRSTGRWTLAVAVLIITAFLGWNGWGGLATTGSEGSTSVPSPQDLSGTAPVTRGPLSYEIESHGSLDCVRKTVLTSKVEWTTKLTRIVPEGTFVKEGDLVAELDVSKLTEEYGEERVDVLTAETKLTTAREELRIQEIENRNSMASATLARDLTELAVESYREAEYLQEVDELERQIAEANDALHMAREGLSFTSRMVRKDLKSSTEEVQSRLKLMQAQRTHADLIETLRVLREHTHPRTVAELQGLAATARRDLDKQEALGKTLLLTKQMQVDVATRRLMRQKQQFDWATRMLKECEIRAPHDGQVVYVERGRDWDDQISPGMEVRFRQALVIIPNRSSMQVAVRVHETLRRHLNEGIPAVVTLDSDPKHPHPAHVASVSAFPLSGHWPNRDRREYEVIVELDDRNPDLTPGLSAAVDLIAASKTEAIQAPVDAITEVGDRLLAFVRKGDRVEAREVVPGESSKDQLEILHGLDVGERVVLMPREHCPDAVLAWQEMHSDQRDVDQTAFAD